MSCFQIENDVAFGVAFDLDNFEIKKIENDVVLYVAFIPNNFWFWGIQKILKNHGNCSQCRTMILLKSNFQSILSKNLLREI